MENRRLDGNIEVFIKRKNAFQSYKTDNFLFSSVSSNFKPEHEQTLMSGRTEECCNVENKVTEVAATECNAKSFGKNDIQSFGGLSKKTQPDSSTRVKKQILDEVGLIRNKNAL